jgi:hypothetical protein
LHIQAADGTSKKASRDADWWNHLPGYKPDRHLFYYDGWSTLVGEKTYSYAGVDTGKAYLIEGQKLFQRVGKTRPAHSATGGDLKKLIENAVVAEQGVVFLLLLPIR